MYAIEVGGIRVEAENESSAKRELRKRMAAQEKKDQEAAANYKRAESIAMENGYRILCAIARAGRKKLQVQWRICDVKENGFGVAKVYCEKRAQWGFRFEGFNGCATIFPYDAIVKWLCNGAGYPIAVALRSGGKTYMMACGVAHETVVMRDLPGISPEMFQEELP